MNKLITTETGGFPLNLDRIAWLQNSLREAITNMAKFYGNDYILYGSEVDVDTDLNTANVTAGAVVIGGEVCTVDAQAIVSIGAKVYLQIVETYDPSGSVVFLNATNKQVHAVRKAVLASGASTPSGALEVYPLTAQIIMQDERTDIDNLKFVQASITGAWTALVPGSKTWNSGTEVIRQKLNGKTYHLAIDLNAVVASSTAGYMSMTIPHIAKISQMYWIAYDGSFSNQMYVQSVGNEIRFTKSSGTFNSGNAFTCKCVLVFEIE